MSKNIFTDITVGFKWRSFGRFQLGKGFVAFDVDPEINYDPSTMFVHINAEAMDDEGGIAVENDCRELARLLAKFRLSREYISDKALNIAVTVD